MAYRETDQIRLRKDAVRQAILDAAQRLIGRGGFGAAQMAAVAAEAGIATGTIYRYFPKQADLFGELFKAKSQRELDAMAEAIAAGGSAREQLSRAVLTFAERALRNRRQAYALLAEPVDPQLEQLRLRFRRSFAQTLEQLLAAGIASGEFPAQDARVTAAALVGAMAEALLGPLVRAAPSARRAFIDTLLAVCLRMAGAMEISP